MNEEDNRNAESAVNGSVENNQTTGDIEATFCSYSSNEKFLLASAIALSIVLFFIPSFVVLHINNKLSPKVYRCLADALNFETVVLLSIFVIKQIPVTGQIICIIICIYNLIVCVQAILAIEQNKKYKFPYNLNIIEDAINKYLISNQTKKD